MTLSSSPPDPKSIDRKLIVGAYAAYSSSKDKGICWPILEELSCLDFVGGLEVPVTKQFQIFDSGTQDTLSRFLTLLRPGWRNIVTLIPGTMQLLQDFPRFGLASNDEQGRNQATEYARSIHRQVMEINQARGELVIEAIELHSAPVASAGSSVDSLVRSLREICSWDWQGVNLFLEHCDRYQRQFPVAKGFLSLEEEFRAWEVLAQGGLQLLINWGRSALEARDPENPQRQIQLLRSRGGAANALGALMFSGVTPQDPLYGEWLDSHAPFTAHCPNSLMTRERVVKCLKAIGPEVRLGFKIQALPASMPTQQRVELIRRSGEFLLDCIAE